MQGALSGRTLGSGAYRVGALLGQGAMGAVYEGVQDTLGRVVAIKVLHAAQGNLRQDQFARFQREARAAAALGHANIVQITDFQWVVGEPPFLVMEKLVGQSLGAAIARSGTLPPQRIAFIAAQTLSALHAAHQAGIVHRDIKPDNVFLTVMAMVNDIVKVLDFGVAKLLDEAPITMAGAMVGSPAYMPPEQAYGRGVDGRADIYAIGATMYHALSGVLPVDAKDAGEFLAKVELPAVPLVQIVPGIDPALSQVVARAMAKRPEERFPTADAMREALMPWAKPASTAGAEMMAQVPIRASVPPGFPSQATQPAPPGFAQGSQAPGFAQGSQARGFAQGSQAPGFAQGSQAPGFAQGSQAPGFAQGSQGPSAAAYTAPQPAYGHGAGASGGHPAYGQASLGGAPGTGAHAAYGQASLGGAPVPPPSSAHCLQPVAPTATAPGKSRAGLFVALGVAGATIVVLVVALVVITTKKPIEPPSAPATTTSVSSAPLATVVPPPSVPSVEPSVAPVVPAVPSSGGASTRPKADAGAKPQDAGAAEEPRRSTMAKAVICSGPPRMIGVEAGIGSLNRILRDRCLNAAAMCPLNAPTDRTLTRSYLAQLDAQTRSVTSITSTNRFPCYAFDQCLQDSRMGVLFHQVQEGAVPLTCTIQP